MNLQQLIDTYQPYNEAEARDREDSAVFLDFMREEHIRSLEEQIADYLRSQDDI